jgi:Na+/melibiose symporter-like transporter
MSNFRERFIISYKLLYTWHKIGAKYSDAKLIQDNSHSNKKTYDVFISYAHEDHEWVTEELVPKLEKEHQFKCCFHERDFQIGVTVMQNIVNCVDKVSFIYYVTTCMGEGDVIKWLTFNTMARKCEKYFLSFPQKISKLTQLLSLFQFVYFLREVTKTPILPNCKVPNGICFDIIVNFIIPKLKSKHTSLKKYT